MKLIIVIPTFNEEKFLKNTLDSFENQTYKNFTLILVNDGSTDKTQQIAESYLDKFNDFRIVEIKEKKEHEPGAKIVRAFYKGLNTVPLNEFDIICKFDADIILPINYFEKIVQGFKNDSKIGMVGGHIYIQKNNNWIYENVANKKHIRGALKAYRKECFNQMNGIRETIGWDNIDELLAIKNNWKIVTLPELKVKLLKETGFVYKNTKAKKLGEYFYNLGLDPLMSLISCIKAGYTNKSFNITLISYKFFLINILKKSPRKITKDEIIFIKKYRWKLFFSKFKLN